MSDREYYLDSMGITRWRLRGEVKPKAQEIYSEDQIQHPLQEKKQITVDEQKSQEPSPIVWFEQQENPSICFLAQITNAEEQKLLMAIVQACAKEENYTIGSAIAPIESALVNFSKILVFGANQAQQLDPNFMQNGVYQQNTSKIVITYTLKDLIIEPSRKRELWQIWQNL